MPLKTISGWIEWRKRGTKNPKRYAYRRRYVGQIDGKWQLSTPVRLREIRPKTEEEYNAIKQNSELAKRLRASIK